MSSNGGAFTAKQQDMKQAGKAPFTEQATVQAGAGDRIEVIENDNPIATADPEVPTEVVVVEEWLAPHYDFMGANLGGQSIYNCGACWALVNRDAQAAHSAWHRALEKA